ncbi:MAG: EthD family reductase [Thermoleophilia bacterium]
MFKAIVLLKRKPELTREAFLDWWLGGHADLARDLPGLRRLVFNVVEGEDAEFDGVSELWFDTREDFEAAYATEHGKAVAADSLAMVSRRERLLVDERPVVG